MQTVVVGIIGAGRATELHMAAYRRVYGVSVRVKYIYDCDVNKAQNACASYGIENAAKDILELFLDQEVNVIDICTPPYTHKEFVIRAMKAGKHVICEKPLCGYFEDGNSDRREMLRVVEAELADIEAVILQTRKLFMYAENFIYAPAVEKAAEILHAKGSKILFAKGEESLAGSSSPVAGEWRKSGGGTLMRVGSHPLSAIIWLKKQTNPTIHVTKVSADIAQVTKGLSEHEHRHIMARPVDVEDTAVVTLTFSDGTKAVVIACDTRLGGSKNYVELYCNDAMIECNLTMHNAMSTYLLDEEGMDGVELSEMLLTKKGWNHPFISDEIIRGYTNEMQDFMECVSIGREPKSGFTIAAETVRAIYMAYCCNE